MVRAVAYREILEASALEQADLIRRGEISSEELTMLYLDRIAVENPRVNAFVQVLEKTVLADARAIDKRARSTSASDAKAEPFLGVPIGIKDLNPVRGSFTRFGSRAFERLYTPFDDATTARLRRGGFVVIGKTSTSELGSLPVTEPDIHPPTRNPWDLDVTPGGSSGGAGAAVAARMIPIAQGSDAAGSIRIPSSLCLLFGHKPSRGRVENSYGHDDRTIIYSCGPLARTVDDAAAMLDVMSGITMGEPHWAPPPPHPFAELARRAPHRLRIRFTTKSSLAETHPEVAEAVRRVARTLEKLGHSLEEGAMLEGDIEEFLPVWQQMAAQAPVHDWALTQPVTRWLGEQGKGVKQADIERLTAKMEAQVLAWFGDADVWLTPTVAVEPERIGAWRDLTPPEAFARAAKMGVFTAPFNVSGQPAASVPAGLTRAGHPIGVQIAGRPLDDATVLRLARQIEQETPWIQLRPPRSENR
jgi:amidase